MHKTVFAILGLSSAAFAAQDSCLPEPAAPCYPDDCKRCYCVGPAAIIANAPVCPVTCEGDFSIEVSALYWCASEDGLEYAIDNAVENTTPNVIASQITVPFNPGSATIGIPAAYGNALYQFPNLVDASYLSPHFEYDVGFKLGLSYCTPCDGWDLSVSWTSFRSKSFSKIEAEPSDNHVLFPLWSAFTPNAGGFTTNFPTNPDPFALVPFGQVPFATEMNAKWELCLNYVDIELGREFWVSRRLNIRPHVGLRIAKVDQAFIIEHKGGAWLPFPPLALPNAPVAPTFLITFSTPQPALTNEVFLRSDFKGGGVRAGLDSGWHLGCGWSLYGNFAASIVYGRFDVHHDEQNRKAEVPFSKVKILETNESFRASRAMLDLGLGLQWATLFCECKYGLELSLGWEQHTFFHQNQFWSVARELSIYNLNPPEDASFVGPEPPYLSDENAVNNSGENVHSQRRGNLDTQGWTLKVKFAF